MSQEYTKINFGGLILRRDSIVTGMLDENGFKEATEETSAPSRCFNNYMIKASISYKVYIKPTESVRRAYLWR